MDFKEGDTVLIRNTCSCCNGRTGIVVSCQNISSVVVVWLDDGRKLTYLSDNLRHKTEKPIDLGEYEGEW